MKLRYQTYTASQAEAITGVKQATVRNWRRAGYLGTFQGHARYDLRHLITMFVMGMLVNRGATPGAARDTAGAVSRAVFQHAAWSVGAFSGDAILEASNELDQQIASGAYSEITGDIELARDPFTRGVLADAAQELAGFSSEREPSWLVVWADGAEEYLYEHNEYDAFFTDIEFTQDYVKGPVTLYCLGALSKMLVDKLPHPAFALVDEMTQSGGG